MKPTQNLILSFLVFLFLLIFSSTYIVHEGQRAIVLQLGKMKENGSTEKVNILTPGLHFKWPLINNARFFDVRLQTLTIDSSRIVTAEKKDVIVDYYVKWKIENIPLYFKRTSSNEQRAEFLLEQKLNDALRAEFGKRTIREVVSGERSDIMLQLKKQANISAKDIGVAVIDVRIKRIDLPDEVSSAVFDRMRAEREQAARSHRSKGKAAAEVIRATADSNVIVTLAKAKRDAERIRADGDAKSAEIYANAYKKDTEFYAFYRSLQAYRRTFQDRGKALFVLQPKGEFFKYFQKAIVAK